jgi:hypothetical protein
MRAGSERPLSPTHARRPTSLLSAGDNGCGHRAYTLRYAGLGDHERALAWIDMAVKEKAFSARFWAEWNPPSFWFGPLRGDPRFAAIMSKVRATKFSE